jgi:hypothetical protein
MEVNQFPGVSERYFGVWACLAAAARSGYFVRWEELSGGEFKVTMEKWVAGVKTILATIEAQVLEAGDLVGIGVRSGKVTAWRKHSKEWKIIAEASDATYSKGYAGLEGSGSNAKYDEFSIGELGAGGAGEMPNARPDFAKQCVLGNNKRILMISVNGKIYSCNSNGEITLRHTGTVGTIWDFQQFADTAFKDWVYCCNGTDTPQKWDGASAETVEWKATKGALPNGSILAVYEDRLMISGVSGTPQRVFFSQFGDPEAANNEYGFLDVRGPDDELDFVTAIVVLGARCFVFHRRNVFAIFDPVKMNNRRIGSPGAYSRFQVAELESKLYFFNPQGLWSTAGEVITMESGSINNWFPEHLTLTEEALSKARLLATKDSYPRLLLSVAHEGNPDNSILIEMVPHINFRRIGGRRYLLLPAFMLHTFKVTCLVAWNPHGYEEIIIGGQVGKLYRLFHGENDDGEEIQAHWQSSWMAIQGEEPYERVRRLNVELSGDAIVDVFGDFSEQPKFSQALPNPQIATQDLKWEGGIWEGGIWGGTQVYRFTRVRPESRARFHSIKFRTLESGKPFFINVAELAVRGGKEIT